MTSKEKRYSQIREQINASIRKEFRGSPYLDDLLSEGQFAAWKGIEAYPGDGSFLGWCRNAAIIAAKEFLKQQSPVPPYGLRQHRALLRKEAALRRSGVSHQDEVLEAVGLSYRKYVRIKQYPLLHYPLSLDCKLAGSDTRLIDTIPAPQPDPRMGDLIAEAMECLAPDERLLVQQLYFDGVTMKQIIAQDPYRRARSTHYRIHADALEKLRRYLHARSIRTPAHAHRGPDLRRLH